MTDRKQCTLANPFHENRHEQGDRWEHDNVSEVPDSQEDGWPSGDTVQMTCGNCGQYWTKELPQ